MLQVEKLKDNLAGGDADGDTRVNLEELKEALKGNRRALAILDSTSVEGLMAKYDVDDDGELSHGELIDILAELAEKEAEIAGEHALWPRAASGSRRRYRGASEGVVGSMSGRLHWASYTAFLL